MSPITTTRNWWRRQHRPVRIIVGGIVTWAVACSILVAWVAYRQGRDAAETHNALCTLRHDLVLRVHSSREFLADHPRGIPGISPIQIRVGIDNQQRTVDALAPLSCKE